MSASESIGGSDWDVSRERFQRSAGDQQPSPIAIVDPRFPPPASLVDTSPPRRVDPIAVLIQAVDRVAVGGIRHSCRFGLGMSRSMRHAVPETAVIAGARLSVRQSGRQVAAFATDQRPGGEVEPNDARPMIGFDGVIECSGIPSPVPHWEGQCSACGEALMPTRNRTRRRQPSPIIPQRAWAPSTGPPTKVTTTSPGGVSGSSVRCGSAAPKVGRMAATSLARSASWP